MLSWNKKRVTGAPTLLWRYAVPSGKVMFCSLLLGGLVLLGTAAVVAIDPRQAEDELIILTNVDRTSNGVQALIPDNDLRGVARFRSDDMVTRDYFSHFIPPDGHQVFDILDARGIPYLRAGENLGRNNAPDYVTVETAEQAFMNSPRHRAILLWAGYTNLGTGVAQSSDGMKVYTALFTEAPSPVPASPGAETPIPSPSPQPTSTPVPSVTATEEAQPTSSASPTATHTASATATSIPSPTSTPLTTRVELPPARAMGLIEQIVRRILSLFLNLG